MDAVVPHGLHDELAVGLQILLFAESLPVLLSMVLGRPGTSAPLGLLASTTGGVLEVQKMVQTLFFASGIEN